MANYRENLALEDITNDHKRRWYHRDRLLIGSQWSPDLGGSCFIPNYLPAKGWELVERDGDRMVLINPDEQATRKDRYRVCYDGGYDGFRVLAYSLRPELAYRFDEVQGAFVSDQAGKYAIVGDFPDYRLHGTSTQLFIGPGLNFYREPQDDIFDLARGGALNPIVLETVIIKRNTFQLPRCETCQGVMPVNSRKGARFCSIQCTPGGTLSKSFRCIVCANDFERSGSGNHRICSERCRKLHKMSVTIKPASNFKCATCGTTFQRSGSGNHRFCSAFCKTMRMRGV